MEVDVVCNMVYCFDWQVCYVGLECNIVVWIIGESFNCVNMLLYGYECNILLMLEVMCKELIVFCDVVLLEFVIMVLLMKMFMLVDFNDLYVWNCKLDVLMLVCEVGFWIYWLFNQLFNDGWLGLVLCCVDEQVFINKGVGCGENNFDGNLLLVLEIVLYDLFLKKLIVVYLLGVYFIYDMCYLSQYVCFDIVCDGVIEKLEDVDCLVWICQLCNEYDNVMVYNDYVVGSMLKFIMNVVWQDYVSLFFSFDYVQEVGYMCNYVGQLVSDVIGYEILMLVWICFFIGKSLEDKVWFEYWFYQIDQLEYIIMGLMGVQLCYYDVCYDIFSEQFGSGNFYQQWCINGQFYLLCMVIYNQIF